MAAVVVPSGAAVLGPGGVPLAAVSLGFGVVLAVVSLGFGVVLANVSLGFGVSLAARGCGTSAVSCLAFPPIFCAM